MTAVFVSECTPSPALVFAEIEHVWTVNALRLSRTVVVIEALMTNGDSISEDVVQYIVYPVIMPFAGFGNTHEAESVLDDRNTFESMKFCGAEGTKTISNYRN